MLNGKTITANKKGDKVRYIMRVFVIYLLNRSFDEVKYYLKMGYKYDDFFILVNSVKTGLNLLINYKEQYLYYY